MADIETNRDYEQINRPYNQFLERSIVGTERSLTDYLGNEKEEDASTNNWGSLDSNINGSVETKPVKSDGAIGDIWIKNFVRSENWKPKSVGFAIDGQTGYAEFTDVFISGEIEALSGNIGGTTGWTIETGYIKKDTGVELTSAGMAPLDYPFYAGAQYANRATAPFRVSNAGILNATGAIISGAITATSGSVGGFDIGSDYIRDVANSFGLASTVTVGDDVRFWAGSTFANRATAPLRMTEAGILYATGAVIDGTSTLGGRIASVIASAITASGNFIDTNLDTSAKTILSDFSFSPSDYSGAFKTGTIAWNTTTGAITGGTGVVINKNGIIGALAGATTFSILTDGSATFAGTLAATGGTFGSITGGSLNINSKFIVTSSGDVTMKSYALISQYTAGENLTAGRLLCLKHKTATWGDGTDTTADRDTTAILSAFTYVDEDNPATATGAAPNLARLGITAGNNHYYIYGKIDLTSNPPGLPAWNECEKILLRVYVVFAATNAQTPSLYRLTAAFTESTVDWNTKPADDGVSWASGQLLTGDSQPGDKASTAANLKNTGYIEFDITQLYNQWSSGTLTNNGFVIKTGGGAGDGYAQIGGTSRTSGGSFNQAPFLAIIVTKDNPGSGNTITANDGQAYLASNTDYNKIKNIIGIAGNTVSASATADVYGLADRSIVPSSVFSTTIGKTYYLTNTDGTIGALTNDIVESDKWDLRIGTGVSAGLSIDLDKAPVFIRSENYPSTGILPPPYARMAIIKWSYQIAGTYDFSGTLTVYKDRYQTPEWRTDTLQGTIKQHKVAASWASGTSGLLTVTITDTDGATSSSITIYWYK